LPLERSLTALGDDVARKRFKKIIAQPALEFVVQYRHARRMDAGVHHRVDTELASNLGLDHEILRHLAALLALHRRSELGTVLLIDLGRLREELLLRGAWILPIEAVPLFPDLTQMEVSVHFLRDSTQVLD